MNLQIVTELQGKLLLVTARGTVTFDSVARLFRQTFDAAAQSQVNKILVNVLAAVGELAAFERYRLGADSAAYLNEREMNVKLALVGVPPITDGFGVRIAQNRGVVARVFSTQLEALSWLDEPPGSD
jgi:hypothetical protein